MFRNMIIVEIGIKLDKSIEYYDKMLRDNGATNLRNLETVDYYWANQELCDMTENEMKNACIRFRMCKGIKTKEMPSCRFQNYHIFRNDRENEFESSVYELPQIEAEFYKNGYERILETKKLDHQYRFLGMKSMIQLQDIENIGLLVYYDNPDYYDLPAELQRQKLIEELNSYGFEISVEQLGLDKLRTLYLNREMYSENQNG
jgi:adenylate cyclase class IV